MDMQKLKVKSIKTEESKSMLPNFIGTHYNESNTICAILDNKRKSECIVSTRLSHITCHLHNMSM